MNAFANGYSAALVSLGLEKTADMRSALRRVLGGAAMGSVVSALGGLSSPDMGVRDIGKLMGIGALGGAGLGAASHALSAPDPAPLPVRVGMGGALGGGIGAGIPYLAGVRDPEQLKRMGMFGAAGGAGFGLLSSIANPARSAPGPAEATANSEEELLPYYG